MLVKTQFHTFAGESDPFRLECGRSLSSVTLAYETYGRLNGAGDNAVLIVHGFTAGAHAAGIDEETGNVGWWNDMIGPGKTFDTDRYFVVSSNVLGGCCGSTGPASADPATGAPYGSAFPVVTIGDMVEAQFVLLRHLGVTSLATVSGASMGGQQALQWMAAHPDFVRSAIPIACSARLSAMALALSEVSRRAIVADPAWLGGNYYGKAFPIAGLSLARMAAHLTYISPEYLEAEFGRSPGANKAYTYSLGGEFDVQEYLRAEGDAFVARFDPNSFLYLSQAIEYFDLTRTTGSLVNAFQRVRSRVLLLSFSSDWLFTVEQTNELEAGLREAGSDVAHVTVQTPYGHDAFLTDWQTISPSIKSFLAA